MILFEMDGPPLAWFEDVYGIRHPYTTFALIADNPSGLAQAYAKWREDWEILGRTDVILWRSRPTYMQDPDKFDVNTEGAWRLSMRVLVLPLELVRAQNPGLRLDPKAEGEAIRRVSHG